MKLIQSKKKCFKFISGVDMTEEVNIEDEN